ncbi:MAG: tubulin-like doman-containing protein [Cyanomargarita calcarea GSE-NOS-MK-12-04C]|jgi:hypothetical protein|uniref:Tubulin-like doman-containing protein n=1 Tax=Cyanomargarita calcarea GSE-NOS-MK-12-04C TaxID=2839659 RepID=A0A951QN31_9CYAN|nr:tubulin-like doman-containing protein [Cyanomargarita calcarea GSE-NOS-MK-12-04C]
MAFYIIGIGGTGAKCIESVIHLASIGLFAEEPIRILFIDADESNGNVERTRSSLNVYQKCFKLQEGEKQQASWMKTPIESYDLWSPFNETSTNRTLGSFFNYNNLKQNYQGLGNLFDVLYTQEERDVVLDVGFRGRPAIGSAIMSQVDLDALDNEPWGTLISQIQSDVGAGKPTKIFLCGSMFGGTGASGLPTIGRLIANKLKKINVRDRVKVGCLFMLPYFGFSPDAGKDPDGVYAQSDLFLLNTEAALRYYESQAEDIFDTVYLLGNQNFKQVKFSIGKNEQRNESHFIELYAASAARQFFLSPTVMSGTVMLIGRDRLEVLGWSDIPEQSIIKAELVNATRFAYAWLAKTAPDLKDAKDNGIEWAQKYITWFSRFFRPKQGFFIKRGEDLPEFGDTNEQETITIVSNWCKDYLRWLSELHLCEGDNVQLFMSRSFMNSEVQLKQEEFPNLVISDSRDKGKQSQDTVQSLHVNLISEPKNLMPPNQGTAGLAKALYILSRL